MASLGVFVSALFFFFKYFKTFFPGLEELRTPALQAGQKMVISSNSWCAEKDPNSSAVYDLHPHLDSSCTQLAVYEYQKKGRHPQTGTADKKIYQLTRQEL